MELKIKIAAIISVFITVGSLVLSLAVMPQLAIISLLSIPSWLYTMEKLIIKEHLMSSVLADFNRLINSNAGFKRFTEEQWEDYIEARIHNAEDINDVIISTMLGSLVLSKFEKPAIIKAVTPDTSSLVIEEVSESSSLIESLGITKERADELVGYCMKEFDSGKESLKVAMNVSKKVLHANELFYLGVMLSNSR
jgi:hypothetical protein